MTSRFHLRSFVSFLLFMIITWLLVSGTVLYISPPGRVANWQHWVFLGLDKEQWQAQHTLFSYFFVILAIFHIFFLNWRNLWSYVKLKTQTQFRKKKEFLLAAVIILGVFFGTHMGVPPFSSFYNLGENIGFSWEEKQEAAPIPHTENLSLEEVSTTYLKEKMSDVITKLENNSIAVENGSQTLREIAIANGKSPSEIYAILNPQKKQGPGQEGSGKGYGRMTLEEMANDMGMEMDDILVILKSNNIEAKPNQTIRSIAEDYDLHPSELVKIIQGD